MLLVSGLNEIVVERFARYYLTTNGWGPLTPVLTLGHLSDREVDGCANAAAMAGDREAESLVLELDRMTRAQRALVAVKAEKAAAAMEEQGC